MKPFVIVTGASRGIGSSVAERLAGDGFCVGINFAKSHDRANELLEKIISQGGEGFLLPFDVGSREAAKEAMEKTLTDRGVPWGIVSNAGIAMDAPFPVLEDDMWDKVINTNLTGFYNVIKPVVMPMASARKGGRIIAMSSISGITGNRGQVNYAASKAGLTGAVKSLALELAKRKITANVVAPGIIETDMVEALNKSEVVRMIPMRRYGTPEEVAALTAFLMSDDAGYITGQVISVNGGMV
ncbi:MAG: 3-oxoacyl-ACP reductase FabG [Deltaproteobacteria bacterium]|nr:3-oxoacyl-ACP reductase FabG [Deltaproteobacteria bacterium]